MFKNACKDSYAVGAFNVNNIETIQGTTRVAKKQVFPSFSMVLHQLIRTILKQSTNSAAKAKRKNLIANKNPPEKPGEFLFIFFLKHNKKNASFSTMASFYEESFWLLLILLSFSRQQSALQHISSLFSTKVLRTYPYSYV